MTEAQKKEISNFKENGGSKLSLLKTLDKLGPKQTFKVISNETEKLKNNVPKNSLLAATNLLKENGAYYAVKFDATGEQFEALYFSMPRMQQDLEAWPEYMAMDGTYKLLNLKYPVIIVVGIDGNGATRIFGMFIVKQETKETIEWCFQEMKKHNAMACEGVKVFMGDKDIVVREVIRQQLPNLKRTICIFHAMQTFRRTVNGDTFALDYDQKKNFAATSKNGVCEIRSRIFKAL
ncbi:hypothetical protein TKK_0002864 [Trichogramma kaykai]